MSKIPYRPIGSERSLRNVFYSLTRREGNYKKDQLAEYVACLTLAECAGYSREVLSCCPLLRLQSQGVPYTSFASGGRVEAGTRPGEKGARGGGTRADEGVDGNRRLGGRGSRGASGDGDI